MARRKSRKERRSASDLDRRVDEATAANLEHDVARWFPKTSG
jgi:hypothetical protein